MRVHEFHTVIDLQISWAQRNPYPESSYIGILAKVNV